MNMGKRHLNWITTILILAIGASLRLVNLGNNKLWLDEVGHLNVALADSLVAVLTGVRSHAAAAPGDYLLLRFFLSLGDPHSLAFIRLPYVIYGVLTILIVILIGRRLYDSLTGLVAGYFLSISFFHIKYSQEVRFYSLSALIGTLSTLLLFSAIEKPRWKNWIYWGAVCLLGLYTHYYLAFLFLVQILWLGVFYPSKEISKFSFRERIRLLQKPVVVLLGAILLFLPWYMWAANASLPARIGDGIPLSPAIMDVLASFGPPLAFLLFAFFGLFSNRFSWLLFSLAVLPFFGVYISDNVVGYFFHPRQVIFSLPLVTILCAASLTQFGKKLYRDSNRAVSSLAHRLIVPAGIILILVFHVASIYQIFFYAN